MELLRSVEMRCMGQENHVGQNLFAHFWFSVWEYKSRGNVIYPTIFAFFIKHILFQESMYDVLLCDWNIVIFYHACTYDLIPD